MVSIRFYSILSFLIVASASTISFGQTSFASYDCRFHSAEVELPIEPIAQSTLDELEIPFESVPEWDANKTPFEEAEAWKHWSTAQNMAFDRDRGNMPMINDLQSLHPFFRDRIIQLVQLCKQKGIELAVVETYRTAAKQHEYKTLGAKYTRSGAGKSKHQYGMAVDVVPMIDSIAQWDDKALWRKVGVIGERLGLRWGGRWRSLYDPGHFEWTGGLTSVDLGLGKLPAVPNSKKLYPCLEEDVADLRKYWAEWTIEQSLFARQ